MLYNNTLYNVYYYKVIKLNFKRFSTDINDFTDFMNGIKCIIFYIKKKFEGLNYSHIDLVFKMIYDNVTSILYTIR